MANGEKRALTYSITSIVAALFAKHDGIGEFKMQSVLSVTKEQKP
jgi:hypothetical protein